MTPAQALITISIIAVATLLTRALPFWLFPGDKPTPKYIIYLGSALPCATIGMLLVYCIKSVQPSLWPHGLPELLAIAVTVGMQLWKRNSLISIVSGTVVYMVLIQSVFA
ncbi:branched-chain amino acid transporter permease [Oscillospiraceae bacterium MB08-C2-2]|nr:branched-chain amino acid transporter permease [Oscillospiraceae bacterium MB08-C2-2]